MAVALGSLRPPRPRRLREAGTALAGAGHREPRPPSLRPPTNPAPAPPAFSEVRLPSKGVLDCPRVQVLSPHGGIGGPVTSHQNENLGVGASAPRGGLGVRALSTLHQEELAPQPPPERTWCSSSPWGQGGHPEPKPPVGMETQTSSRNANPGTPDTPFSGENLRVSACPPTPDKKGDPASKPISPPPYKARIWPPDLTLLRDQDPGIRGTS